MRSQSVETFFFYADDRVSYINTPVDISSSVYVSLVIQYTKESANKLYSNDHGRFSGSAGCAGYLPTTVLFPFDCGNQ